MSMNERARPAKAVIEEVGFLLPVLGDSGDLLRIRLRKRKMLKHHSHIRMEARRRALNSTVHREPPTAKSGDKKQTGEYPQDSPQSGNRPPAIELEIYRLSMPAFSARPAAASGMARKPYRFGK